jgi:excisionase family DNA binding protein
LYLCPKEVAVYLNVSERTAQRLMAKNDVPSFRVGAKLLRTDREHLCKYVARQFERYRRAIK